MWNERYAADEYIYGTAPNTFLVEHTSYLQDPVLSIGEGEGRNAAYLAKKGFHVLGVDGSEVGLLKAQKLATSEGVHIDTETADLEFYMPKENAYRGVISIFAHLPSQIRQKLYPRITRSLQPGGVILLEAYTEKQLSRNTGGPKDIDMLMSSKKIRDEFPDFEPIVLQEMEREVSEGLFHTGLASVIQFVGRKRSA